MEAVDINRKDILEINTDRSILYIIGFCLGIEFVLIALDLLFNVTKSFPVIELQKIFNMTRERSAGTWFSVTLFCLTGGTLLLIFLVARADKSSRRDATGMAHLVSDFFLPVC